MEIGRVYLFYARTGLIGTWQAIPHMFTWVCRRRMNYWAPPKFRERMTTDEPWLLKENDEPWHLGVGWIIGRHQSSENIWRAVFGLGKIPYNCWCPTFFFLVQIRVFFLTQTSLQPYRNRKMQTSLQESEEEPNKSGTRPIGLHYRDFLLPSLPLQREPNTAY